jgi:hypothetical protein
VQIRRIADDRVHAYGHIGKKSVLPISFNGIGNLLACYSNGFTHLYA